MRIKHKDVNGTTDFLASLALLQHDPELLHEVLPQATAGNVHAQYAAGLIYAEGRGVEADPVESYVWLTRAYQQGDEDAGLLRSMLMSNMTFDDIALAEQRLVREVLI